MTLREIINQRRAIEDVAIDLPGIKSVRVRRLSLDDMLAVERVEDSIQANATLVVRTIVDEQDQPLFADIADATADGKLFTAVLKATAQINDLKFKVKEAEKN